MSLRELAEKACGVLFYTAVAMVAVAVVHNSFSQSPRITHNDRLLAFYAECMREHGGNERYCDIQTEKDHGAWWGGADEFK